ncbi:hypothetical protein, partial [Acinetobacter baumannii]|uniref:hypothetical protein n=1 Tax=Acinetobacter baumannii TaxID=470 RepID=UPI00312C929F
MAIVLVVVKRYKLSKRDYLYIGHSPDAVKKAVSAPIVTGKVPHGRAHRIGEAEDRDLSRH